MNPISAITPAQTQIYAPNYSKNSNAKNVNFTGHLGDKFVRQIMDGNDVNPKTVLSELKGTFGIKSEKVEDVMESFIESLKEAFTQNKSLRNEYLNADKQIREFPVEKEKAVRMAQDEMNKNFGIYVRAQNEKMAAKDAEITELKSQLEKYEPLVKVKSVEELDTIMPEKAIEILDEIAVNRIKARESMLNFLMTGQGQEEALKQLERVSMIEKAGSDGILNIKDVKDKCEELQKNGIRFSCNARYSALQMISAALEGNDKGRYIASPVIEKQVKDNAMAILTPLADNRYSNTNIDFIKRSLDEHIQKVKNFHSGFELGLEKYKKNYPNGKFEVVKIDYDPENSYVKYNIEGNEGKLQFWQIANYGQN